jgi:hypothetical protein
MAMGIASGTRTDPVEEAGRRIHLSIKAANLQGSKSFAVMENTSFS